MSVVGTGIHFNFHRPSRIYSNGDTVSGLVILESKNETKYDAIQLNLEGLLSVQISQKGSSLIDSFAATQKPVVLYSHTLELSKGGSVSGGKTHFPFDFKLEPKASKTLHETYHGSSIVVQYTIKCILKRGLLAKDIVKTQEIFVENKCTLVQPALEQPTRTSQPTEICIKPSLATSAREKQHIPSFRVLGRLDEETVLLSKPLTGEICVLNCEGVLRSIDLQLVRVETCGSTDVHTKQVSDIQTSQICCGDIPRGISIPIYVVLPKLLTCASVAMPTFKIEFEVQILVTFDSDLIVKQSMPITIVR